MSIGNGSIQVVCPQCNKQLAVPAQHAGKQGRCPACKSVFAIPAALQSASASPPQFGSPSQYASQPNWQTPAPAAGHPTAPSWPATAPSASAIGPGMTSIPNPYNQVPAVSAWNAAPQPSPYAQPAAFSPPSPFGAPATSQPMPMNGFEPLYQNQHPGGSSVPGANPFADQDGGELRLAPVDSLPAQQSLAPAYSPYAAPTSPNPYSGAFGAEKRGMGAGILGGLGLMLLAIVWFFGGLAAGIIFFYPPVLFIIGIVAVVRGLFNR